MNLHMPDCVEFLCVEFLWVFLLLPNWAHVRLVKVVASENLQEVKLDNLSLAFQKMIL